MSVAREDELAGFVSSLTAALTRRFDQSAGVLDDPGLVSDVVDFIVDRAHVDTDREWTEHLGGFYTVNAVRHLLSRRGRPVTKQAVSKRRDLLALKTGSGRVVYPKFQFRHGRPVAGLSEVLAIFDDAVVSPWTVASWLVSPNRDFEGDTPIEVLAAEMVDPVVAAARSWTAQLAA